MVDFTCQTTERSHIRIPAARCARVLRATLEEGAGNAGCFSRTHSLMCKWKKHMSVVTTG